MKTKNRAVVALALLAGSACANRYTSEPDAAQLAGTWNWASSSGGIAGQSFTPASMGYSVQFKFENGKLIAQRNDSLKASPTYSFDGTSVTYAPAVNVFTFDPQMEEHIVHVISEDSISLADPCCDRYSHIFVRAH